MLLEINSRWHPVFVFIILSAFLQTVQFIPELGACVGVYLCVGRGECVREKYKQIERKRQEKPKDRETATCNREQRRPVKQPTLCLLLFLLRDRDEVGYASWTSPPPSSLYWPTPPTQGCSAFPWRRRICLQVIAPLLKGINGDNNTAQPEILTVKGATRTQFMCGVVKGRSL